MTAKHAPADHQYTNIKQLLKLTNKPKKKKASECQKRALLVGISYKNPSESVMGALGGTETDVMKMASALEAQGYQLANIRVLVDGYRDDSHWPTKANILAGIDWLTKGCRQGDFRVFYYSGHGCDSPQVFDSKGSKVYDKRRPLQRFDEGNSNTSGVPEITYSREAIVPEDVRWYRKDEDSESQSESGSESGSESESESGSESKRKSRNLLESSPTEAREKAPQDTNGITPRELPVVPGWQVKKSTLIFDTELNEAFSKLPRDCTLTCFFDCCHSGRILSLPIKMGGGGHRNASMFIREVSSTSRPIHPTPTSDASVSPATSETETHEIMRLINNLDLNQGVCIDKSVNRGMVTHHVSLTSQGAQKTQVFSANQPSGDGDGPICDDRNDVDSKALPRQEQETNKIIAHTMCWSAAHQRQPAYELGNGDSPASGIFTTAFCDALQRNSWEQATNRPTPVNQVTELTDVPTYQQVLDTVAHQVYEISLRTNARFHGGQFAQLWSNRDLEAQLGKPFQM